MSSEDAETKGRRIRVPDDLWTAYGEVCARLGTNRTADLLDHMSRQINQHGSEAAIDRLVSAQQELADRRSRMSTGRRPKVRADAGE